MTFHVQTTRRAEKDRDLCFNYIDKRNPEGALSWLEAYEAAIDLLVEHPHRGLAPESLRYEEEIRQSVFKTAYGLRYRLLFIIRGEVVHIIHVRGFGQDLLTANEIEIPDDE